MICGRLASLETEQKKLYQQTQEEVAQKLKKLDDALATTRFALGSRVESLAPFAAEVASLSTTICATHERYSKYPYSI